MQTAKQAAKEIVEQIPEKASWDEIMYEFYVKQKIDRGLEAVNKGQTISNEDAKNRLLGNAG